MKKYWLIFVLILGAIVVWMYDTARRGYEVYYGYRMTLR